MFPQLHPEMYLQLHATRQQDLLNEADRYRLARAARVAARMAQTDRCSSRRSPSIAPPNCKPLSVGGP
jgi:hypothetical protein